MSKRRERIPSDGHDYPLIVRHSGPQGRELYDHCLRELMAAGMSEGAAVTHTLHAWPKLVAQLNTSGDHPPR